MVCMHVDDDDDDDIDTYKDLPIFSPNPRPFFPALHSKIGFLHIQATSQLSTKKRYSVRIPEY